MTQRGRPQRKNDVFTATSSPFASQRRILSGETRSSRATSVTVNPRSGLLSNPANDQGIWLDFRFDGALSAANAGEVRVGYQIAESRAIWRPITPCRRTKRVQPR